MKRLRAWLYKTALEVVKFLGSILWTAFCMVAAVELGYSLRHHLVLAILSGIWCFFSVGVVGYAIPSAIHDYRYNRLGSIKTWAGFYGGFWLLAVAWPLPLAIVLALFGVGLALVAVCTGLLLVVVVVSILMTPFGLRPEDFIRQQHLKSAKQHQQFLRKQLANPVDIRIVDLLQDELIQTTDTIEMLEKRLQKRK
jgi:hypothetical protein